MSTTCPAERTSDIEEKAGQDARIRNAVIDALFRRGYSALWQVQVSVDRGRVTLHRENPESFYLRQVAQSAVLSVPGVDGIDAALEIAEQCDAGIRAFLAFTENH